MRRAFTRRLRGASHGDVGISLVELLVTILITTVVLVIVGSMFSQVAKIGRQTQQMRDANAVAANAAEVISRGIRSATGNQTSVSTTDAAIVSASSTSLLLYSMADAPTPAGLPAQSALQPTLIEYIVTSGHLVEKRWAPVANGAYWKFARAAANATDASVPPTSSRTLSGSYVIDTTGTNPLFQFEDVNQNVFNPNSNTLGLGLGDVAFVTFNVNLRSDGLDNANALPILISNTVGMPNLGLESTNN